MANVIYQLVDCLSFRCGVFTIEHRFDFTFKFPLALVGDPSGRCNCAAHSRCCPFILNRILSDEPRSGSGLLSTTRRQPKRSQRSLAPGNGPRDGRKGRLLSRAVQHPQAAMCQLRSYAANSCRPRGTVEAAIRDDPGAASSSRSDRRSSLSQRVESETSRNISCNPGIRSLDSHTFARNQTNTIDSCEISL